MWKCYILQLKVQSKHTWFKCFFKQRIAPITILIHRVKNNRLGGLVARGTETARCNVFLRDSVEVSASQRPILTLELEIAGLAVGLPISDSNLDSSLCSSEMSVAAHTLRGGGGRREKKKKKKREIQLTCNVTWAFCV